MLPQTKEKSSHTHTSNTSGREESHTDKYNTPTCVQPHSEANTLSDVLDVRRFLSVSVDVIFR